MDIPVPKVRKEALGAKKDMFSQQDGKLTVTQENATMLTVHFLSQIYARLGYLIKVLEKKDSDNG